MERTRNKEIDPVTFAVIKARLDGIIMEMSNTVLMTSRNPLLWAAKDFSCFLLNYDAKLLNMVNVLPVHPIGAANAIPAVVECFKGDIHPGDAFVNNSTYYGNTHVGDFTMYAPVFYEGELVCWAGTLCHLIDSGAYIPSNHDPLAKDIYEEGIHFPAMRLVQNYKGIPEKLRLIKANFRYPEQWHGDFLAQVGSLFMAERRVAELCRKYGVETIKQFQDEYLDYGDRRMTEEVKKLPKGTWEAEAPTEKVESVCPDGLILKVKMSIDPDEAMITYDLTENPDQLPWGLNLTEATCKGACVIGTMPSLDTTLPKNHGVYKHFDFKLREGSVAGIPKYPAATACATICVADVVSNMIFGIWERVLPGKGHAGCGYDSATEPQSEGVDFRRNNERYGHLYSFVYSGSGASKGCDGWPNYVAAGAGGNMALESVELHELRVPDIMWEVGIQMDSGGPGRWRGAPAGYQKVQSRHTEVFFVPFAFGHTEPPPGVTGGYPGGLGDHWIEKHATGEKVKRLQNVGPFKLKEDEDWVSIAGGGGGYGDPLERDPEAVRNDARNYIISVNAAKDIYGVVLNTEAELYDVDYEATEKLRAQLKRKGNEA
ncbi:hydantoinase B/oxoprolinase family protein [Chloroflexota bacterium]